MNDLHNETGIFTASNAKEITERAKQEKEAFNVHVYEKIIQRIKEAASRAENMIRLEAGSDLDKLLTTGTINKLREAGFEVNKSFIVRSIYDSDYVGTDIKW